MQGQTFVKFYRCCFGKCKTLKFHSEINGPIGKTEITPMKRHEDLNVISFMDLQNDFTIKRMQQMI